MLKNTKSNKGFTIIEVLIVLAIAGLIMLIVFLAVPALQRNQRNTSRKNDSSRVATAASNYVTNSNGQKIDSTAKLDAIIADAGTMAQFPTLTSAATPTKDKVSFADGSTTAQAAITVDGLNIVTGAKCDTAVVGKTLAGNARQMALQYPSEKADGTIQGLCMDI
jgi:prepilin-type N-terminal cleavage/methylation domain-containing protein